MSDQSTNNDAWLSKLRSHMETECYGAGTVSQYMGVARRFVADLNKRRVAITAARPEDIDRYLQQAPWTHPLRHEDSPDYRHWRSTPLNMLLRVVHGQWPPVAAAVTPATKLQQEICEAYSLWMVAFRGLAQTTILCRRSEACCFLVWLGACDPRGTFPSNSSRCGRLYEATGKLITKDFAQRCSR
ncbi:MAG: hypothetical protein ABSE96_21250 [Terracidiphilus sp.]|jgi:hypothetical protein